MKTVDSYTRKDGWSDTKGIEICPHCEKPWSMNGGMKGPAYTQNGTEYEYYIEGDASKGPFFCESCFEELETNRKQEANAQLTEYV